MVLQADTIDSIECVKAAFLTHLDLSDTYHSLAVVFATTFSPNLVSLGEESTCRGPVGGPWGSGHR